MPKNIKTSLIISTYNWSEALNLCLLSVLNQTVFPGEIIIADDGSNTSTKALIDTFKLSSPIPIIHIWQPDEGFQLSKIRNKAVAAASNEYIIQIDGDLILHRKFIQDHVLFSKKRTFVTGSRVVIGPDFSNRLLKEESINIGVFDRGLRNRSNGYRIKFLRNYLSSRYRVDDIYYLRGCNMAFWRKDFIEVNGYNEEFIGWGREDNEIAARLINLGLIKRVIKFGGVVFHIYHPEKSRSNLDINDEILTNTINTQKAFCDKGVNQYL